MHVLREGAGCQVYRPTWSGTRTILRPFPGRNPEAPTEWDPFRLSEEPRDYGDWIRRYSMAMSLGNPGVTFVIKNPMDKVTDDQQNPVWMLYRAVNQAIKAGSGHPSWNPLIFGAAGRSAPLSAPKDGYVMQGILMEHKSVPCQPPKGCQMQDRPVVFLMSQSAGNALLEKLEELNADGTHRWDNLTDLNSGMYIQFHQAGTQNRAAGAPRSMTSLISGGGGGGADNNRYDVEFLEDYNGILPSFDGIEALAAAHVKLWDDIIRIPTVEEQVGLICGAGIPASAIVYALGDVYGDVIPQHIHDKARAEMGGAGSVIGAVTTVRAPAVVANPMTRTRPAAPPVAPASAESPEPVATTPAAPAQSDAQFDPPPTSAETSRTKATMAALNKARERAKQAQQP
jgi:hypothetical protein